MKDRITDDSMVVLATMLQRLMPPNWGFTLLVFENNNETTAKVLSVSNSNRKIMMGTMQSMLDKWKAMDEGFIKSSNN